MKLSFFSLCCKFFRSLLQGAIQQVILVSSTANEIYSIVVYFDHRQSYYLGVSNGLCEHATTAFTFPSTDKH